MTEDQKRARVFGVLFLITFVTSIGALALFQSVLDDPAGYIAGDGKDSQIYLGAFLELLLVISNVGTAVVLYPIVRRQNELLAIGYVAARIIESVFIAGGIIFILGVVSLRQDSPDAADLAVSLAALKDWTFLFGPGMIVPFGNGLILGYLMYKSGLVPRWMPWLGLIGGPLLLLGNVGVLFDWWDQTGAVQHPRGPRVPLGAVPRDLCGSLGIPEGLADPVGAHQQHGSAARARVGSGLVLAPTTLSPPPGSGCWPCPASPSRSSSFSHGSSAEATRLTTPRRIRTGRPGRTTTSGKAGSVDS